MQSSNDQPSSRTDIGPVSIVPVWLMAHFGSLDPGAVALYAWLQHSDATSQAELAQDLGVTPKMIRKWRDQLVAIGALSPKPPAVVRISKPPLTVTLPTNSTTVGVPPPPKTEAKAKAEAPPSESERTAHALAVLAWEMSPTPMAKGGFVAVRKLLVAALEAGHPEGMLRALITGHAIKVWTLAGIETAIAQQPGAGENPDGWWLRQ